MEKLNRGQNIGISQYHNTIPFYNGDFQFLEKNLKKLEKIDENEFNLDYDFKAGQFLHQQSEKTKNNLVATHWNRNYREGESGFRKPYRGYQHPDEIDWSRYGPDRPGKATGTGGSYLATIGSEFDLITVLSFFGLVLPGILGTLFFLGVPLTQVYLAGASLVTMYFLTGRGKSLEDESLTTEVLLNILELLEVITEVAESNQE